MYMYSVTLVTLNRSVVPGSLVKSNWKLRPIISIRREEKKAKLSSTNPLLLEREGGEGRGGRKRGREEDVREGGREGGVRGKGEREGRNGREGEREGGSERGRERGREGRRCA